MEQTVEQITEDIKDYASWFYNGGGDTTDAQEDFKQLVDELIKAVENRTLEVLSQ